MVARILIGNLPGGTRGVRVSQPGYDVTNWPANENLLTFNSDLPNILSIRQRGRITVTGATNGDEASTVMTIPNQGYRPLGLYFYLGNGVYTGSTGWVPQFTKWRAITRGNNFSDQHAATGAISTGYTRVNVRNGDIRFIYRRPAFLNNFYGYPTAVTFSYILFDFPMG